MSTQFERYSYLCYKAIMNHNHKQLYISNDAKKSIASFTKHCRGMSLNISLFADRVIFLDSGSVVVFHNINKLKGA